MSRSIARRLRIIAACAAAGCAGASAPSSTARPSLVQQGGEVAAPPSAEQVAYGYMAAVAMRQTRLLTSTKIVGLYQGDDPRAPLYPIINAILNEHPFREIHQGQTKIACTVPTRPGLRGSGQTRPTCGLDVVDVLLQVNSVQIMGDTGYVAGYLTEVLPGEDRPRSSVYCFIAVARNNAWVDVRNSLVKEPKDCTSGGKH